MSKSVTQPTLADLLARFMERQAVIAGDVETDGTSEVQPHLATGLRTLEPSLAWQEATCVGSLLATDTGIQWHFKLPEWSSILRQKQPVLALPMALGNFPQLVQDLAPLFQGAKSLQMEQPHGRPLEVGNLHSWGEAAHGKRKWPEALMAVASLRMAARYAEAQSLLQKIKAEVPSDWMPLISNEEATLAWEQGRVAEAVALWRSARADNVVSRFNLALASLREGRTEEARAAFAAVAKDLPNKSAWQALAQVYAAVASL